MFWWFSSKKRVKELEEKTQTGFNSVKEDINKIGSWIKHLDNKNKQLFDIVNSLQNDLSSVKDEIAGVRESVGLAFEERKNKQLFKKLPVLDKQTPVETVQNAVQTAVQTGNIYSILNTLSTNEKALIVTLMGSDMKLSYEDLALLLGKERSTIRGQINSIKQKSEDLIAEIVEKNGKKRVYVPEEIRNKMTRYAKVRGSNKFKHG